MMACDLFGLEIVEPQPVKRSTIEAAICACLKGISADSLVAEMYSRTEAVVDFAKLCDGAQSGQKISMLFNQHRYATATVDSCSIVEAFRDDRFLSGLSRAICWKEGKVKDLLYQVLQVGINGVQYVNEFPPALARDIMTDNHARRVLDPCAGWGGRMIGAASVGAFYHGFEPCQRTFSGLLRLAEFLDAFQTGFTYQLDNLPFEDATLDAAGYDLALTSPPYYDTERYDAAQTQSAARYGDYPTWRDGWLLPMIERAATASTGGLVINVGSRRYPIAADIKERFQQSSFLPQYSLSGRSGLGKESTEGEVFISVPANEGQRRTHEGHA
jgi:hypothetical protein